MHMSETQKIESPQEALRKRLEQLKKQQQQGTVMVENLNREMLMIAGAIGEVTTALNLLIAESTRIEAEKKAKADAEKAAKASKKKKASKKAKEVVGNGVTTDLSDTTATAQAA